MSCPEFIKTITLAFLTLTLSLSLHAQDGNLLRSSLNTGGSSGTVSIQQHFCLVQQSIGQSGPIGLSSSGNYLLRQGFLQPMQGLHVKSSGLSSRLSVYPNPFQRSICIILPDTIRGKRLITLHDMFGKTVFSAQNTESGLLSLPLPSLAPGLYLLRISSGIHRFSTLLIKE